jgi:hypothetical protein
MSAIKYLFAVALLTLSTCVFAQNNDQVFLKWKLKPGETLSYKTVLEEVDTATHKNWEIGGFFKSMGIDIDAVNLAEAKKVFKQLSALQPTNFIARLTEKKKGIIDITLVSKADSSKKGKDGNNNLADAQTLLNTITSGVQLRGSVYENGTIASFYTRNDQKNVIALLFELPGKRIKQGDTWPVSFNFISTDQSFTCDSSYKKNEVTVLKIENQHGEHIVTLKYDIVEYVIGDFIMPVPMGTTPVKTSMGVSYQAIASFSIEKGKWIGYEGIMKNSATGVISTQSKTRYALIEE